MYPPVTVRILALALCGWLLAGEAGAASLGRAHGAALIRRPLTVTLPVSVDPSEIGNPSAELFHGDSRETTPSVRWEASSPAQGELPREDEPAARDPARSPGRVPAKESRARRKAAPEPVARLEALQKSPQEFAQDAVRLQGVERELDTLQAATRQNAAELAELRAQVDGAHSDRKTAVSLVVLLSAVLFALLAWMAWRWHRVRQIEQVGRWFEAHGNSVQADIPMAPDTAPAPHPSSLAGERVPAASTTRRPAWVPVAPALPSPSGAEFQASRGGTMRRVGVQELIDMHDKADFFLSIGETEQAIAALEAHVHDQVETGALAWLDLLELYHSLGRRADFERLRAEFRQHFTAQVPDFEHFDEPGASLENYSRALSRVVALWPSRRVLDVIEESIFRKPGPGGAEPFSLQAYRELVLLYHIAKDLLAPETDTGVEGPAPATTFRDTSVQPLHTLDRPCEAPLSEHERLMIPPASARLGVDIDLEGSEPVLADAPPLDFDISAFDPASGPAGRR